MSTFEGLPGDEELLETFPEAACFLTGEGEVALGAIMSTLERENGEFLDTRFDAVRLQFEIYEEQYRSKMPGSEHWQSFHKLSKPAGEHRLWVLNDSANQMLRAVSNEEVRDGGIITVHYEEFALHGVDSLFGRRSGTAIRPPDAKGWQAADLGTCSLMERLYDGRLKFTRGTKGGPPVLYGPGSGSTPAGRIFTDKVVGQGLTDLENLLTMFVTGSCYEPGVTGKYR